MGYQQAYTKTPSGVIEVKHLARAIVMEAKEPHKNYFDSRRESTPFRHLFRYIQTHNIPMTTPVEVNIEENGMLFYAPLDSQDKMLLGTSDVNIKSLPERTVVSIGIKGSYNQANFDKGKTKLYSWLDEHQEWKAISQPYAVYWDSPYSIPVLKHSEVRISIARVIQ